MLAYGAQIVARGPNGERVIPITEFFVGPFTPALESNEILTEIRIPAARAGDGGAYLKIERKVGDYATAAVGVQLHTNDGRVERVGIGLTNLGLMPIHATAAQEALLGQPLSDETIAAAAQAAGEAAEAVSDYRGSEDYKRALVRTLTTRAIRKAAERAN
jgi:carbon-monoxide dehydrogenase medium subunit